MSDPEICVVPLPFGGVDHITMRRCQGRDQVVRRIDVGGWNSYEAPLPGLIAQIVGSGPFAFLDVGANTGFYTLLARAAGARVLRAFEPMPFVADLCAANLALNGAGIAATPALHRIALSDFDGETDLYVPTQEHGLIETSASLSSTFRPRFSERVAVTVTTLDRHLSLDPLPDGLSVLVKIDVESQEAKVLAGAVETVRALRPWVVLELLPQTDPEYLQDFVLEHRYRHFRLGKPLHVHETRVVAAHPTDWDHLLIPREADATRILAAFGEPA